MPEERSLYLFASVLSAAIFGVEVCPVQVEADVSNGLPSFIMVGFPSAQVKEAQERVRTALKNNGYQFPPKRITVNFAPADMKKEGAGFDVPVAAAVLAAFEIISSRDVNGVMMAGEIGLDGEIIQCIPTNEIAYASNNRNNDTVSIECCHPDESGAFQEVTYQSLVELVAFLCGKFNLTMDNVIRHYDVTGKDCPKYFVEHEDAWNAFKEDVAKYIEENGN